MNEATPPKAEPEKPDGKSSGGSENVPARIEAEVLAALQPHIPRDKAAAVSRAILTVLHREEFFSGPLPPPQHLDRYEKVLPGAAERIVAMAEREQRHRHGWENKHLWFDGVQGVGGQLLGGLVLVALIAAAVYCAYIQQPAVAVAFFGVAVAGVVGVLIKGRPLAGPREPEPPPAKKPKRARRR